MALLIENKPNKKVTIKHLKKYIYKFPK